MTDEEALIRLEELKKVENRPVDKKTLKRLWELRCQVYRIKDCEQKLQAAKTRQPDFGKEVTKNMDDYNTRKNAAGSSGFLAVVFILLSIAVVVGYVVFCVLDAKNGWDVFYPVEEGFTLTYLVKVLLIGVLGGAVAIALLCVLFWAVDTIINKICYATYDTRHAKDLYEAQAADEFLRRDAEEKFTAKKEKDIQEFAEGLEEAKAYVAAFTEVPDEVKQEEHIDFFYKNMELTMNDGVPFDVAFHIYYKLFKQERELKLYYYTVFPRMEMFDETTHKKKWQEFGDYLDQVLEKLTKEQQEIFLKRDSGLWVIIHDMNAVGKIGVRLDRVKTIKTKKDAKAFFEETMRIYSVAENMWVNQFAKK